MDFHDYYRILGVDRDASPREIREAYESLVKKYHPDRNPGNEEAAKRAKWVNIAYDVLSDEEQRREYDRQTGANPHTDDKKRRERDQRAGASSPARDRKRRQSDERLESVLRPTRLDEIAGQGRIVENLRILIEAAKARHEPLDHVLFYGPPELDKTTFAHVISNEMEVNIRVTAGPSVRRADDLAVILTHLREGDILFIDEIHRLSRAVEEVLYPTMEDFALDIVIGKGPSAKNVRLHLPRFTVIGATTRLALLTAPLRSRFGAVYRLDFYDPDAMREIVRRAAVLLTTPIDDDGIEEIARRARGTPRVALRLLKRVRDFAEVCADGVITGEIAFEALSFLVNHDNSE